MADAMERSWHPLACSFRPYQGRSAEGRIAGNVAASPSFVVRLTRYIAETYQACNPTFTYSDALNPKRYLTNPSAGVSNNGLDNKNSDLILAVNDTLVSQTSHRYIVREMLGHGTFGQVVKCWSVDERTEVAVKVIKNQPAYYQQALVEIELLTMLNRTYDPDDSHHIVRILDSFLYQGHLCIAFELLSFNLYELIKVKQYRGISLQLLRLFTKQMLDALGVLREARVIHCDLKPENILLTTSLQSGEIKLIDFGSACLEHRPVYSYIQSRFYRSPEVVLGHPYTTSIDMWSLGCVAAELFLGLPLFPGDSEYDLLQRMIETLGCQPPDRLLRSSKNTSKYFRNVSAAPPLDGALAGHSTYRFLTEKEYEAREKKKPAIGKQYLRHKKLEDIIKNYPFRSTMTTKEIEAERANREAFLDFLKGLVDFDPVKRWSPNQAAQHPFITNEPFVGPYVPFPEAPRNPVCLAMMTVEHNPGAGHWFAAGLSPQVPQMNARMHYSSPQYHTGLFSYASSYGSYGSCDGAGFGSSYGSYSDVPSMYLAYPTPPQPQLGFDTRVRVPPPYCLGLSPSNNSMKPMSLGCSPSQFTPPASQFSPGSPTSPGRYGPTSPVRFGRAAAVGQYHKRRGFNPPAGFSPSDSYQQHQHLQQQQQQQQQQHHHQQQQQQHRSELLKEHAVRHSSRPHHAQPGLDDGYASSSRSHGQTYLRQSGSQPSSSSFRAGSIGSILSAFETAEAYDGGHQESESAVWDPNYSNMLQDDGEPASSSGPAGVMGSGGARLGPGQGRHHMGHLQASSWRDNSTRKSELGTSSSAQHSSYLSRLGPQQAAAEADLRHMQQQLQPQQRGDYHFLAKASGGFTAGYQSSTEQIDRHLTGMMLTSGIGNV